MERSAGGGARTPLAWAWRRLPVFLLVGGGSTLAYGLGYLALRTVLAPQWANAVALVGSTLLATDGHRRLTFHVHARRTVVPHQVLGLVVLCGGLAVTSGALWLLHVRDPSPGRVDELAVLAAANAAVGLVRFVLFALVMREPGPAVSRRPSRR